MFKKSILYISILLFIPLSMNAQGVKKSVTLKDTIKDKSIEVPRDLDHNLEQLLVDWKKSFKESPKRKLLSDEAMNYPDSIYINRLYNLPSEMELAYNQIVRSYIDMYTTRRRSSVEYMLAKGAYYFPIFEETLDKYGLPLELKYLPVIESALNPVAVSRMGATGLWQFMLGTGKMYDLEVNSLVDERRDPAKATEAAAKYLKDMYNIYGDWNLVIAAYNCGPGNVNKAIRRSGGQKDYWAIYPFLPKETRGYVPAFIAATYVMNYYSKHNIYPMEYAYPTSVDTIVIDRSLHLQQISSVLNFPIEDIRDLNPQYKKDIIPGNFKSYTLCLPSKITAQFINNQDSIYAYNTEALLAHRKTVEIESAQSAGATTERTSTRTHKVRRGESLGSIARKYGVTTAQLKRLNNLRSDKIIAGKHLIISKQKVQPKTLAKSEPKTTSKQQVNNKPAEKSTLTETVKAELADIVQSSDTMTIQLSHNLEVIGSDEPRTIYHKVKLGETLLQIAKRYNITVKDIQGWNKLSSKKAPIGERLKIILPEREYNKIKAASEAHKAEIEKEKTDKSAS